jgi:hypothetical protein
MTRRRWLLAAAAIAVVPLAAVVALVAVGVSIDASPWRNTIAARASAALGRQVAIEGPLEVILARESALRIGGIRILSPPGFSSAELASLGEARARVDLLALLRGRLVVRGLEASDARVNLERAADGRANWAGPTREAADAPGGAARLPVAIEIERTTIRALAVEYRDARSGARRFFDLDELVGTGSWNDPLALSIRGRAQREFPYLITIEGGSARLLAEEGETWPFTLDFEFLGTRLHASGAVAASAREAQFDFGAGTESLEQVERFLETKLPKFGSAALSGHVAARADAVDLTALHGLFGAAEVTGRLAIALGAERPRLTGELAMAELDLRPFLRDSAAHAGQPLAYDDLANDPLALRDLVPIDVALKLRIDRWTGLAGDVREAMLELAADQRGVRAPLTVTIADVPLAGRIELDTAAATPTLAVELGARGSQLGNLARLLGDIEGVTGTLERFDVRVGGRGETLGALVRDLEARLDIARARLSYGNFAGGRPVEFTLDSLALNAQRGQRLRGTARGTLLGERGSLEMRAGELPRMLRDGSTPIELGLATAGVKARIEGTLARAQAARSTALAIRIDAKRSGDLARWFGIAPQSKLPVALRGGVRLNGDEWHLDATTLKLGRSEITVDLRRTTIDGKPIVVAAVRSPLIDVPELETLRERTADAPARSLKGSIDVPILPYGIDLADTDIGLGLERVVLGRAELVDFGFGARIREGRLPPSPFAARLAGVPFQGMLGLDLRGEVPEASLAMSTGKVDVGALLRILGVAEDLEARADGLQVELVGRGNRVRDLLERSSFEARLAGGSLTLRGPGREAVAEIRLKEAVVAAPPGQRITARLDGALDATPVEIRVASGTLADFARDASKVPFSVDARAAGASLKLEGEAALPLGRGGQLTLDLAGERLDSLSALAHVQLPPWGPWSLRGPIAMTATGYEVRRLALRVGESRLVGRGTLDVTGVRPKLDLRVTAPHIQLDDFPRARNRAEAPAAPRTAGGVRANVGEAADQTQALLGRAFLRRYDAYIDVVARQVLSGQDRLGDGTLRVQLVEGRLYLGPAEVNLPGGTARLSIAYDPTEGGVTLAAGAYIERFDYGIIARRQNPGTDIEGLFSLDMELTSKAPSLNEIMAGANGRIDLAVWPKNQGADAIDLWVVNIFRALLPVLERGRESQVNCAVGRFDLRNGTLTHDALLIDTTQMRVLGAGGIEFATEEIDFRFRPRAKGLQFFSLETPVRVTGTLTDFNVGVAPGDVLATIARFLGSVIVVPIEWLFRGPMPRDGADVCTDPMRVFGPAKQ